MVDPTLVDPLEYLYGGNTAIAAMQYSYLPSWISFLVDKDRARQAGRTLFTNEHAAGSPERLPIYGDEQTVRFAASAADLRTADDSLRQPRVVLLWHASDPIRHHYGPRGTRRVGSSPAPPH
ncbi:MAG TPA: alpha/beta-hydrolase family protein [Mycobacterium sp.]|nr:alpha/beta-hydrolase family protein [Mycobacterium sp.]